MQSPGFPTYPLWGLLTWAGLVLPLLWLAASAWPHRAWSSGLAGFTSWTLSSVTVLALLKCLTIPYGWLHAVTLVAALACSVRTASLLRTLPPQSSEQTA